MESQLPAQLVQLLAPFLPYLLKGVELAGQEAAKKLGEKAGEQGFEQAKALWDKLRRKKNVEQVAQTAAALPDNQALREALREEIARALDEDPTLREEVTTIFSGVEVGDVKPGGKVTGVKTTGKSPKKIRSTVKADNVAGEVTGVEFRDE
jgi:hypothetical protein